MCKNIDNTINENQRFANTYKESWDICADQVSNITEWNFKTFNLI